VPQDDGTRRLVKAAAKAAVGLVVLVLQGRPEHECGELEGQGWSGVCGESAGAWVGPSSMLRTRRVTLRCGLFGAGV